MNNGNKTLTPHTEGEVNFMKTETQPSNDPTENITNAFSFTGRVRRSTYWSTVEFLVLAGGMVGGISWGVARHAFSHVDILGELLIVVVPLFIAVITLACYGWSVQVRRCHDLGWSGWLVPVIMVVSFVPFVGWIVSLIFGLYLGCIDGQPFTNQYGPDPKGRHTSSGLSQQPPMFQSQQTTPVPTDLGARLHELKNLLDEGLLTQDEFDAQKVKVLTEQKL